MNILFLATRDSTNPFAAGGDIHLSELARRLAFKGHKVTYVCTRHRGSKQEETVDGVRVLRFQRHTSYPFKVWLHYLRQLRGRVDIVVEEVIGGIRPPFLAPLFVREPLVGVWYQRNTKIFLNQFPLPVALALCLLEYALALLYRLKGIMIVTDSSTQRTELVKLGLEESRIRVCPPGVGNTFIFEEKTIPARRENLVVFIGKLRKYKCVHHVVQAMKHVVDKLPDSSLVIAGRREDLKYEEFLAETASHLGLSRRVTIETNISENRKKELLCRASVLVQPSPVEGFGMVILEANACGTPVVASSGVPGDAVRHGYNGLVYQFGDVASMSSLTLGLLADRRLWSKLSKNAVQRARSFGWEVVSEGFLRILEDIASRENLARETGPKEGIS